MSNEHGVRLSAHTLSSAVFPHIVLGSNPGRSDICHRGCAYTVLQTAQTDRSVHYCLW